MSADLSAAMPSAISPEPIPRFALQSATAAAWLPVALGDIDAVLLDHAHLEKKAAASAMALVNTYPDHDELVRRCVKLAQEELRHFQQVHQIILARGLTLQRDRGDPYAQRLLQQTRNGHAERRMDKLLIFALIEARSCERLHLLAGALADAALAQFYAGLAKAEGAHFHLFVQLAELYDDPASVKARLQALAAAEAEIVATLPLAARLH